MSERCVHFLHRMEILARKGLIPRLATLLLEKAEYGVVAGMTHKDLAGHFDDHRKSITATLGELRRAGIFTIERYAFFTANASSAARRSRVSFELLRTFARIITSTFCNLFCQLDQMLR